MKRTLSWIAAARPSRCRESEAVEVEVPGLLTDHTVIVRAQFLRAFSDKWDSTGNITINERPSARWGSWITITANQDVIYQTFLFPTKIDFDKNVALALAQSEDAIKSPAKLLSTSDLAKDEF
jgi:curli production assembly/transport component CsgE